MKNKYVKLFEEFDLDSFLDNPNGNSEGDEIQIGDHVKSPRGMGHVVDIRDQFAKVQLIGIETQVPATIPLSQLTKIDSSESDRVGDLGGEVEAIAHEAQEYLSQLKKMVIDQDMELVSQTGGKILDFLEDTLLDLMNMYKKNSNLPSLPQYGRLESIIAQLSDVAQEIDPELGDRIDAVYSQYADLT